MAENYYHVVAFTGKGLRGNPAGVCLLTQPLPAARLQAIANEIGLPETSFVWDDGDMTAIRWFTPEREVDLCGHGTLAAAHVMFSAINPARQDIRFRSAGGELFVKRNAQDGERLVLDFARGRRRRWLNRRPRGAAGRAAAGGVAGENADGGAGK